MAASPEIALILIAAPVKEPTILEMMMLMNFFMGYGARFTPGPNLISYQLTDMPDDVNAYWMWMHTRRWD